MERSRRRLRGNAPRPSPSRVRRWSARRVANDEGVTAGFMGPGGLPIGGRMPRLSAWRPFALRDRRPQLATRPGGQHMADTNLTLVQETYGAFGRGDIPAVLGAFTADIEWNVPAVLPHGAKARGPEEVGRFFEVLASTWENFDLQLDDFVASGD